MLKVTVDYTECEGLKNLGTHTYTVPDPDKKEGKDKALSDLLHGHLAAIGFVLQEIKTLDNVHVHLLNGVTATVTDEQGERVRKMILQYIEEDKPES